MNRDPKLTDKCREDFYSWFRQKRATVGLRWWMFIQLDESVQNTIIQEFFDSVGIFIDCGYYAKGKMCSGIEGNGLGFISTGTKHENRLDAINSAIEKANEIYNKNYNKKVPV